MRHTRSFRLTSRLLFWFGVLAISGVLFAGACGGSEPAGNTPPAESDLDGVQVEVHYDPG